MQKENFECTLKMLRLLPRKKERKKKTSKRKNRERCWNKFILYFCPFLIIVIILSAISLFQIYNCIYDQKSIQI